MVHIIVYLMIAYCISTALARYVIKCKTLGPVTFRVLAVAILLVMPLAPYGVVELQTILCRQQLAASIQQAMQTPMLRGFDVNSLKVLRKWPRRAVVYVKVTDRSETQENAGFIIELEQVAGQWKPSGDWDIIWCDFGSADGNVFPPYPSKGDYR